MPNDRNGGFRVAVTRDVRRSDGTFTFAPYNLEPLERAGIPWRFLDDDTLTPEALADVDGLYHYATPLPTTTLDDVERLAVIARHGVGLDYLDVRGLHRARHRRDDHAGRRDEADGLGGSDAGAGPRAPAERPQPGAARGRLGRGALPPAGHRPVRPHPRRDRLRPHRPRRRATARPWGMRGTGHAAERRSPRTEVTYVAGELLARGRRRRRRLPVDRETHDLLDRAGWR